MQRQLELQILLILEFQLCATHTNVEKKVKINNFWVTYCQSKPQIHCISTVA